MYMITVGRLNLPTLLTLTLVVLTLAACGGGEGAPMGTSPATAAPTTAPAATPTSTPAATPTSPPTTSPMSLDEYMASCEELATEIDFDKYDSKQEFIADLDTTIEQIEAIQPPPEVADFHNLIIALQTDAKQALEDAPPPGQEESLAIYLRRILSSVNPEYGPKMMAVVDAMDENLVDRLSEAGCI